MTYRMQLGPVNLAADPKLAGEQLQWTDEYEWDPIEQEQERSLNGKLHIQEGVKVYGRPITLASNGGAWFTLDTVRALELLRTQAGSVMQLLLPSGEQHYVTWNRTAGVPVQVTPVFRRVVYSPSDLFEVTLRLITVAPPATPEPEPAP